MPLHIIHTMNFTAAVSQKKETIDTHQQVPFLLRYLRLFIIKPAVGWGVSVWQLDVFGSKF